MISYGTIMMFVFCFGVFVLATLFCCIRRNYLPAFLAGTATFVISQLVLRIPLLSLLSELPAYFQWSLANPIWSGLFAAVTAGLFEEIGRWLVLGWGIRKKHSWMDGLLFGLGHGGIEAAWVGSKMLPYLNNPSVTQLNFFLSGFERMSCLGIHVGLTMVVMLGVRKKNWKYYLLAILLHTAVDFPVVLLHGWILEGYVFLCGVAGVLFTVRCRRKWRLEDAQKTSE